MHPAAELLANALGQGRDQDEGKDGDEAKDESVDADAG
jgi:hypothetical protein